MYIYVQLVCDSATRSAAWLSVRLTTWPTATLVPRRYHGIVHLLSAPLVDTAGPGGRVTVWWPNRTRGKPWQGIRLDVLGEPYYM